MLRPNPIELLPLFSGFSDFHLPAVSNNERSKARTIRSLFHTITAL